MKKIFVLLLLGCSIAVSGQDKKILYEMVELERGVNSRFHDAAPIVSPQAESRMGEGADRRALDREP